MVLLLSRKFLICILEATLKGDLLLLLIKERDKDVILN